MIKPLVYQQLTLNGDLPCYTDGDVFSTSQSSSVSPDFTLSAGTDITIEMYYDETVMKGYEHYVGITSGYSSESIYVSAVDLFKVIDV